MVLDYELFDPGFIGKGVTWQLQLLSVIQCEHFFKRNQAFMIWLKHSTCSIDAFRISSIFTVTKSFCLCCYLPGLVVPPRSNPIGPSGPRSLHEWITWRRSCALRITWSFLWVRSPGKKSRTNCDLGALWGGIQVTTWWFFCWKWGAKFEASMTNHHGNYFSNILLWIHMI